MPDKRSDNYTVEHWQRVQALYVAYLPRIYGYVAARVDDAHEAEDLVSEVFLKAARHYDQLRAAETLTPWLFTIARHTLADHFRRHNVVITPFDALEDAPADDDLPDASLVQAEDAAVIRRLVRTLPLRRQEVLVLKFFGGLRNREIADVLELDEHTVASHLSRGLRDLYAKVQALELEDQDDVDRRR